MRAEPPSPRTLRTGCGGRSGLLRGGCSLQAEPAQEDKGHPGNDDLYDRHKAIEIDTFAIRVRGNQPGMIRAAREVEVDVHADCGDRRRPRCGMNRGVVAA